MSQSFKLKYDQMRDSDPSSKGDGGEAIPALENYPDESNTRNVCFVLADGNRIFLNYSYLVSGEYIVEENRIILAFTSNIITLTGIHLETLFYELMQHLPKQIVCTDARYNVADENGKPVVNTIEVQTNK